jgi:aminoglycoside/choline kinase family phosphotransferase
MPGFKPWVEQVTDANVVAVAPLPAGAGRRRYFRVHLSDGSTRVVMHAVPEDPAILPPALRDSTDRIEFLEVTRLLEGFDIPVPHIHAVEPRERWLLLEDLGDLRLCDLEGPSLRERLHESAALLARVHEIPRDAALSLGRAFDEEWVRFELEHFLDHGAPASLQTSLRSTVERVASRVACLPHLLCLRDYQSTNLMVDPGGRLRVLDYQDALLAPPELDLAAFLYDSYLELDSDLRAKLLETYEGARGVRIASASLALLVVQRKCKDFARFRFLSRVQHDSRFARYEERARRAVLEALPEAAGEIGPGASGLARALGEAGT